MKKYCLLLLSIFLSSCNNLLLPSNQESGSSNLIESEVLESENVSVQPSEQINIYESNCVGKVFFECNSKVVSIDNKSINNQIIFGCDKEDNSGRIKISDDRLYEMMTLNVNGKIESDFEKLESLSIKFEQIGEDNNILDKENSNLYKASQPIFGENNDSSLINLPDCFYNEIILYKSDGKEYANLDLTNNTFSYQINFKWGSVFEGINPGYYYDGVNNDGEGFGSDDEEGNQISKRGLNTPITTVIKNIKSLNNTIYGENQDSEKQMILNSRYLVSINALFK